MGGKAIVLDANILVRAVLGRRVRELLLEHAEHIKFFTPDVAYEDAKKYLPGLLDKRGVSEVVVVQVLDQLQSIIQVIDSEIYGAMKTQALQRIASRDADDWPVLACAMALNCPVWTEDADFFGSGVATWTSDRIALYFA
ncbi:nucleotide-binding protein [Limnohabitans sp. JirII-29]|uniref:PIN domain-containing protein n=1 Tax=Limnohabitans sp. JirII-29 TaxID=1835756 RepID=UPI000D3CF94B|nr:PIN domain-containing protein [Limnohabitans sp. JirII-29]PUE30127.1 nucleotide-binding protein [Limnohabitans sp. JirII-29]